MDNKILYSILIVVSILLIATYFIVNSTFPNSLISPSEQLQSLSYPQLTLNPNTQDYTISGNDVYVDKEQIYISANPHTSPGGSVVYTFKSKTLNGDYNVVLGFDQYTIPKNPAIYSKDLISVERSYACDRDKAIIETSTSSANENIFKCYINTTQEEKEIVDPKEDPKAVEETKELIFEHNYTRSDSRTKTYFWNEEEEKGFVASAKKVEVVTKDLNYRKKWYYIDNINLVAGKEEKIRFDLQLPPIDKYQAKYDVAVYPSSYGADVESAFANGDMYVLDPWVKYGDNDILLLWSNFTANSMYTSNLTFGGTFSSTTRITNMGSPRWIETRKHPFKQETAIYTVNDAGAASYISFWNGTFYNNRTLGIVYAPYDYTFSAEIAYESVSGDLLIGFAITALNLTYVTYSGGSWSNPIQFESSTVNNNIVGVKMIPDPNSDSIILIYDEATSANLKAWIWNGTNWGNNVTLETSMDGNLLYPFDCEWSNSKAVCVWDDSGDSTDLKSRVWDGSSWLTARTNLASDGSLTGFRQVSLFADPVYQHIYGCANSEDDRYILFDFNSTLDLVNKSAVAVISSSVYSSKDFCYGTFYGDNLEKFIIWVAQGANGMLYNNTLVSTQYSTFTTSDYYSIKADYTPYKEMVIAAGQESGSQEDIHFYLYNTTSKSGTAYNDKYRVNSDTYSQYAVIMNYYDADPSITIISPTTDQVFIDTEVILNITTNESVDTCYWSTDYGVTNKSMELITTTNFYNATTGLTDGAYTFVFWCNASDDGRWLDSDSVSATKTTSGVDTTKPKIQIVYPANMSNTTIFDLDVNYTFSDNIGVDSCWWSDDGGSTNYSGTCGTNLSGSWVEGYNYITIYVNDTSNNYNQSSVTFFVDTTVPYFLQNPTNQTIYDNQSLSYDMNASDLGVGLDCFAVNDTTNFGIDCTGLLQNITGLTIGTYWINITINDTLNNLNSTVINITVLEGLEPDILYPKFSSYTSSIANNSAYIYGQVYEFNVTILNSNGTAWLSWLSGNLTATNTTSTLFNVTVGQLSAGDYYYNWTSFGNGTDHLYNRSQTYTYKITNATPNGNMSSENGWTINYAQSTLINYSETNNGDGDLNYTIYRDGKAVGSYGEFINRSAGTYVYILNTTGGQNYSSNTSINTTTLTINKIASNITLKLNATFGNVTINTGGNITLNCTRITGDSNPMLKVFRNGTVINQLNFSSVQNYSVFNNPGSENITCIYVSSQNFTNFSVTYWVDVLDTIKPAPRIIFPANTTYNYNVSNLNYTSSEAGYCWYSNNTGVWNSTINAVGTNFTDVVSLEGSNSFTLYCNDTANNLNSTSVTFYKDTELPYFLQNPLNSTIYNNESYENYFNATDTGGNFDCFAVNNTAVFSINCTGYIVNKTTLSVGTYWINITINDTLKNLNSTVINITVLQSTIVDTSAPNYTNNFTNPTTPATWSSTNTYCFNITWNDNIAISSVWLQFNNTNYTMSNLSSEYYKCIGGLSAGTYTYYFFANDSSDNLNYTSSNSYTISKANGEIKLTINGTRGDVTYYNNTNLNLSAKLLNGTGNINLIKNGTIINEGDSTLENSTILFETPGVYNITSIYNGNINFSSAFETWLVTINLMGTSMCNSTYSVLVTDLSNKKPYGRLCYWYNFK